VTARSGSGRRARGAAAGAIAVALALGAAAMAPGARPAGRPSLKPPPPSTAVTRPAPVGRLPGMTRTTLERAHNARTLEESGAYAEAAEALRGLAPDVPPDADLELAIALDDARAGNLEAAYARLNGRLLSVALVDTLPVTRRTDYPWERESLWINGRFDGWNWYIARARAEVAARLSRWDEARDAARIAVGCRPLAGKEWLILAACAARAGDAAIAERAAAEAAFLDRSLPEAQYLCGLLEWRAGRRAGAQRFFRAASDLDSTWSAPALSLARSRLPALPPDPLPSELLTGVRAAGLVTSAERPKLEEFVQMETAATLEEMINPDVPDSLRGTFSGGEMQLSILIDERGRVVLHELPWYEPARFPAPMVSRLTAGLPRWRFGPARRHGEPSRVWMVIQLKLSS
jgi:hypothetical protein